MKLHRYHLPSQSLSLLCVNLFLLALDFLDSVVEIFLLVSSIEPC
jgi:hypothetical protein